MDKSKKRKKTAFRGRYKGNVKKSSIFFLIWSILTVFTVFIAILFGVGQQIMFTQTYKEETVRGLSAKGVSIEWEIHRFPKGGDYDKFVRLLSSQHGVDVCVLDMDGRVVYPVETEFDEEKKDFARIAKKISAKLAGSEGEAVVFEGDNEYIYGAYIPLEGGGMGYLYVGQSLEFMTSALSEMSVRMTLLSVFIILLSFVISFVLSGWLTKPLAEMTDKAKRLAERDFQVDFHGADYGEEMVELAESLNFARDELAKTDRMQKELIANVSHDFKTPLTMIKAYASMIQEISGDIPEKRDKHAQVIIDEADRLATLVSDVLDLSKMQAGMEELHETTFDMSAYILEIVERFAYLKETQGYKFIVDVEEDLYTKGDEIKLGQVLYNLVGNAVNYTGEDKRVIIHLKKRSNSVFRFEVRDTGAGIKKEELSSVWERYYRSSEMHKRPVKGMGLGLSIVKAVLERHGFSFGVESMLGEGTTFYVDFPLINA